MKQLAGVLLVVGMMFGTASVAVAQETAPQDTTEAKGKKYHFLRGGFQYGWLLQTNSFVDGSCDGEPIENYASVRLEFGWQTDGSQVWHHVYNYPAYGLGLNFADYANDEKLGSPSSLYGFFAWPVKRWQKFHWTVEAGFGLTDNWVAFDSKTNPCNVAIGAAKSVYIDVATNLYYHLAPHWDLIGGFTGTHYSNGGSKQPNYGLNQVGPILYVSYNLEKDRPLVPRMTIPEYEPNWEISVAGAFGPKNVAVNLSNEEVKEVYENVTFGVLNLNGTVARQLSWMAKPNAGLDVTYQRATDAEVDASDEEVDLDELPWSKRLSLGVFVGYEQVVARGSLLFQLGYYLAREEYEGQTPDLYQRLGVKYHVFKNTFIGLNVRFYEFSRAEFLEFNIGQRWQL